MMGNHTPGPWRYEDGFIIGPNGEQVADFVPLEGNGLLIAVLPDLLAACEQGGIWPNLEEPCDGPELLRYAAKCLSAGSDERWLISALYDKARAEEAAIRKARRE